MTHSIRSIARQHAIMNATLPAHLISFLISGLLHYCSLCLLPPSPTTTTITLRNIFPPTGKPRSSNKQNKKNIQITNTSRRYFLYNQQSNPQRLKAHNHNSQFTISQSHSIMVIIPVIAIRPRHLILAMLMAPVPRGVMGLGNWCPRRLGQSHPPL